MNQEKCGVDCITKGRFIGSGCLLMRSGGIALGNITGGWSQRTGVVK